MSEAPLLDLGSPVDEGSSGHGTVSSAARQVDASQVGRGERAQKDRAWEYLVACILGLVPVFAAPESLWWVPVVTMLIYLAVGLRKAQKAGLELEFADSFYYLGFTLSIGSLLASLHPFNSAAQVTAKEELRYFGLGMLTTVVGVVGRTVMQLFYRVADESLEATNRRIQQAAEAYLGSLDHLQAQATGLLAAGSRQAEAALASSRRTLDAYLEAFSGALDEVRPSLKTAATEIGSLAPDVAVLRARLTEVGSELEHWSVAAGEQRDALRASQEAAAATVESAREIAGSVNREVVGSLRSSVGAATDLQIALRTVSVNLGKLEFDRVPAQQAVEELAAAIRASSAQLAHSAELLRISATACQQQVAALPEVAREFGPQGVSREVSRLRQALSQLTANLEVAAERFGDGGASSIATALQQVGSEASRLNQVLDDVVEAATVQLKRLGEGGEVVPR